MSRIRMIAVVLGAVLAATVLAGSVLRAPAAAAGPAAPTPPPGVLTVISMVGAPTLDGHPGPVPHQQVTAGSHDLLAGTSSQSITVGSGCSVLALAIPSDQERTPAWTTTSECPIPRVPEGKASVRFIAAVPPGRLTGTLRLRLAGVSVTGDRSAAAPGIADVEVDLRDRPIRHDRIELRAGHAYTVVFAGGGERTPVLQLLDDGSQTPAAPPRGTPINSGWAPRPAPAPVMPAAVVALALIFALTFVSTRRLVAISLAVVIGTSGCALVPGSTTTTAAPTGVGSGISTTSTSADPEPELADTPVTLVLPHGGGHRLVEVEAGQVDDLPEALRDPAVGHVAGTGTEGGNLVLVGHSTWGGRPGALASVSELGNGSRIVVMDRSGHRRTYVVDGAVVRPKANPWAAAWAPTARPGLVLVTCTGPVDAATGLHRDNLWTTAHSVAA